MSIFDTMYQRRSYFEKLAQIRRKADPKPAADTGATSCQRSGVCCWQRPCDLHPGDDVARLAAHLKITPAELFAQFLIVDTGADDGYRLRPRRRDQNAGTMVSAAETWSMSTPCVFYHAAAGCRVHDAKPTGGAQWHCAMPKAEADALPDPSWSREALLELGWDGETDMGGDW